MNNSECKFKNLCNMEEWIFQLDLQTAKKFKWLIEKTLGIEISEAWSDNKEIENISKILEELITITKYRINELTEKEINEKENTIIKDN